MATLTITKSNTSLCKQEDIEEKNSLSVDGMAPFEEFTTKDPCENDVLCGRGGSINSHPGNERFRILVEKRKRVYLTARFKREKRLIACSIVSEIRALDPPGRFLSRDAKSGLWKDIGDEKARDKTSQALRENAPSIRAEIETEITEQRAEMQQEDERTIVAPLHAPSHPYYNQGWGYPYYAYGPPPPHMPHGPPPPPPHSYPHPSAMPPPHGHYDPYYHGYGTTPDPYLHPPAPKSAFEQTSDLVVSGAESIKNWTKNSFSFGGGAVTTAASNEGSRSLGSKPIPYKHDDGVKKRRMVKFRDDDSLSAHRVRRVRPCYSPVNANDSLIDQADDENDLEPHQLGTEYHNHTLMSQVAHFLAPTMESWDLGNIVCGHDTADVVPFPRSIANGKNPAADESYQDEDDAIEWEGQEVQLVDEHKSMERRHDPDADRRHPPDHHQSKNDTTSSVGFSSLGSCHSWLPEQFGSAASYFSYGRGGDEITQGTGCGSLEMDYSTGGATGESSIGGSSLARVFENEPLDGEKPMISPNMNHRVLSRIPSWERSLRSKSPLSIGSDDESLISKSSSKYEDEPLSPFNAYSPGGAMSAIRSIDEEEDMTWTKE